MDNNNSNPTDPTQNTNVPPLTPLNQPSIDLNSTPPMDQTLVPNSPSAATPPPFDPAPVPTVATPPPEEPKKSSLVKIAMIVLISVIIIALAYMVVSRFSASGTPTPTPAPVEQDIEEGPVDGALDETEGGTQWRDIDPDNPEGDNQDGEGSEEVTSETPAEVDPNSPVEEIVVEEEQ